MGEYPTAGPPVDGRPSPTFLISFTIQTQVDSAHFLFQGTPFSTFMTLFLIKPFLASLTGVRSLPGCMKSNFSNQLGSPPIGLRMTDPSRTPWVSTNPDPNTPVFAPVRFRSFASLFQRTLGFDSCRLRFFPKEAVPPFYCHANQTGYGLFFPIRSSPPPNVHVLNAVPTLSQQLRYSDHLPPSESRR